MKPIPVWLSSTGLSPWKVITVLEELELPYEIELICFKNIKKPPFIDIDPNSRVPAIEDSNTDLKLWESGAIVKYLIKQYNTKMRLHYNTLKEQALCNQWLIFQVSGQGPYFGQCTWFTYLHPEKLPSAIECYTNKIKCVLGVLDGVLGVEPNKQWLVGECITYADLAFVAWNDRLDAALRVPTDKMFEGFPHIQAWHERMTRRPSWVKAIEIRARLIDKQGLDWNGMPKGVKNFQEFQESINKSDK